MKCQKIQDRLLTDFVDAELSSAEKKSIDLHLLDCRECRALLAAVREVDADLASAKDLGMPPQRVWENIRYRIEDVPLSVAQKVAVWFEGIWLSFRPVFLSAGTAFAAFIVVVVLIAPVKAQKEMMLARADQEMVLQLAYADDEDVSSWMVERIGEGTFVEDLL